MTPSHRVFLHSDGSRQAYNIYGCSHVGTPVVLINGMGMLMRDWERLRDSLAGSRPVLVFDHRGMGYSTLSRAGNERVTIELMARDLVELLQGLNWKEIALCGYSMGGAIIQQLLLLPFHPTNPAPLHFRVTHAILAASVAEPLKDGRFMQKFMDIPPPLNGTYKTTEEKCAAVRPIVETIYDPQWISDNPGRFARCVEAMTFGRPLRTTFMQAYAIQDIHFEDSYSKLPRSTQFLIIHGKLDQVVPFSESRKLLARIPWAREVAVGNASGQIPSLEFGHQWFEYFDNANVWAEVFDEFLLHLSEPVRAHM